LIIENLENPLPIWYTFLKSDSTKQDQANEIEGEGVSERANPEDITVQAHTSPTDNEDQTSSTQSKSVSASDDAGMD